MKIISILSATALLGAGLTLFVLDNPNCTRRGEADCEMGEITKALNSHWLDTKKYPDSLEALKKDYFKNGVPKNPYTKEHYDYFTNGNRFFLVCYGKDDAPGGKEPPDADIVYTEAGCLTR